MEAGARGLGWGGGRGKMSGMMGFRYSGWSGRSVRMRRLFRASCGQVGVGGFLLVRRGHEMGEGGGERGAQRRSDAG